MIKFRQLFRIAYAAKFSFIRVKLEKLSRHPVIHRRNSTLKMSDIGREIIRRKRHVTLRIISIEVVT
jgi:hypothetical protein